MKHIFLSFTHAVALTAVNITPVAAKALYGRKGAEPAGSRSSATYSSNGTRDGLCGQSQKYSENVRKSKSPRNLRNLVTLAHKCLREISPVNDKKRMSDTMRYQEITCDAEVQNDWATTEAGIEELVHTSDGDKFQKWPFALVPLL